MSAAASAYRYIIQHCRWSHTGHDGACLDRGEMGRRAEQQALSGSDVADKIGLGAPIVSTDPLDPYRRQRQSAPAAPLATDKSP